MKTSRFYNKFQWHAAALRMDTNMYKIWPVSEMILRKFISRKKQHRPESWPDRLLTYVIFLTLCVKRFWFLSLRCLHWKTENEKTKRWCPYYKKKVKRIKSQNQKLNIIGKSRKCALDTFSSSVHSFLAGRNQCSG